MSKISDLEKERMRLRLAYAQKDYQRWHRIACFALTALSYTWVVVIVGIVILCISKK